MNSELVDRAVQVIEKFYSENKLLSSHKLAQETGTNGETFLGLKNYLQQYNIAGFLHINGTEVWYPARVLAADREKLFRLTEIRIQEEKNENRKQFLELQEKKKKEFIQSRRIKLIEPIIKCDCGQVIGLGKSTIWFQGSSAFNFEVDSMLGSVSCPKCSTQIFWGCLQPKYSKTKYSQDEIYKKGKELGCSDASLLPANSELNKYFSKIFKDVGGKQDFVFWNK